MSLQVLPFPIKPRPPREVDEPATELSMHDRFEARRLVAFLLGPPPRVKILLVAWLDKKMHIDRFLDDYYALHRCLPSGRHNLGRTETHGLRIGVIDFDRMRTQMRLALRREQRRSRRWRRLGAALTKLRFTTVGTRF